MAEPAPAQFTGSLSGFSQRSGFSEWLPALSMMLVSMISYIDRNTLALLAPTILHETRLNAEQYGFIISAFSVAYMLGNPVWGRILDRVGVRAGMSAAVALWTVASACHAFAIGFRSFATARAMLGFGEGATFPGGLRTVMQTLPPRQHSRGVAVAYSGGSFGALITPIVVTPIAAAYGWRGAFWFTGAVGALWLLLWMALAPRKDAAHATLSSQEPSPAPTSPGAGAISSKAAPGWTDHRLWGYIALYALGSLPLGFVLYDTSLYLSAALHKSQEQIGHVLWIPPLGWEAGYFFWGWVTDRVAGSGNALRGMQRQFFLLTLLSLPLVVVPRIDSFPWTMALLFFEMFVAAGFIIGSVAYATTYYSTHHAGLIAGIGAGSWSAMVALVMPGMGRLFDLHAYEAAFSVAALFPILGYGAWRALNRHIPSGV
jgi:ACS family hexuronate transporter-like MFS transporter